jgi:hypothetical protein
VYSAVTPPSSAQAIESSIRVEAKQRGLQLRISACMVWLLFELRNVEAILFSQTVGYPEPEQNGNRKHSHQNLRGSHQRNDSK